MNFTHQWFPLGYGAQRLYIGSQILVIVRMNTNHLCGGIALFESGKESVVLLFIMGFKQLNREATFW